MVIFEFLCPVCFAQVSPNNASIVSSKFRNPIYIFLFHHRWDLDHNGSLDVSELVLGLRKFQEAKNLATTVEESISTMLAFDADKNGILDRGEFAQFLSLFAKTALTELDELIDFMVVQSALKDNDEAEKVYVKTLGEKAQAQLQQRGNRAGLGKSWFGGK